MPNRKQDLLSLCNFNNFFLGIVDTNFKLNDKDYVKVTFSKGTSKRECLEYLKEMGEKLCSSFFTKKEHAAAIYYVDSFPFNVDAGKLKFNEKTGCYYYEVHMSDQVTHNFSVLAVNTLVKGVTQLLAKMSKLSLKDVVRYVSSESLTNEQRKEYAYCASFFNRGKPRYAKEMQTKFVEKFHAAMSEMCDGVCDVPKQPEFFKIEGNRVYMRHFSDKVLNAVSQFKGWSIISCCEHSNKEDKDAERVRNMFIDSTYMLTGIVISGCDRVTKDELGKDFVVLVPKVEYINEQGNKTIRTLTPDEAQAINRVINEHRTKANPSAERLEFVEWDESGHKFIININDDEITSEIASWLIEICSINPKERSLSVDLTPQQLEAVSPSKELASFNFPVAGTSKQPVAGMQTRQQQGESSQFGGFKITRQQPSTSAGTSLWSTTIEPVQGIFGAEEMTTQFRSFNMGGSNEPPLSLDFLREASNVPLIKGLSSSIQTIPFSDKAQEISDQFRPKLKARKKGGLLPSEDTSIDSNVPGTIGEAQSITDQFSISEDILNAVRDIKGGSSSQSCRPYSKSGQPEDTPNSSFRSETGTMKVLIKQSQQPTSSEQTGDDSAKLGAHPQPGNRNKSGSFSEQDQDITSRRFGKDFMSMRKPKEFNSLQSYPSEISRDSGHETDPQNASHSQDPTLSLHTKQDNQVSVVPKHQSSMMDCQIVKPLLIKRK